jgi:hypothetical protein
MIGPHDDAIGIDFALGAPISDVPDGGLIERGAGRGMESATAGER